MIECYLSRRNPDEAKEIVADTVDRPHELKPRLRKVRADSQIATALAVCELVFIAMLGEIINFSAGLTLVHTRLGPKKSQAVRQPSSS